MSRFVDRVRQLASSGLVRAVGVLVGGTAAAQVIIAICLPIATRLYSPTDFSLLALFTGIATTVSVAACLRFDVAVSLPEEDKEAASVLVLAVASSAVVSLLFLTLAVAIPDRIATLFNRPAIASYLTLIPLSIFFASLTSALQFWFVRRRAFTELATNRVAQAAAASSVQIGFGLIPVAPLGLLLGQTINAGAGCIRLAYRLFRRDAAVLRDVTMSSMKEAFVTYSRFPKFSTLEALSNSASIYLPVVIISSTLVGPEAGYIILAMQVMQAPMSLIGGAVAQVYLSRAPAELRAGTLGAFTSKIFGGMLRSGVGPLLFAGMVAPEAFRIVFGEQWHRAGELVTWMTPWFVMQFLSSPISMALHVTSNQAQALLLQIFGLIFRVGVLFAALHLSVIPMAEAYALSGAVFYFIYIVTVLIAASTPGKGIFLELRKSVTIIAAWIVLGAIALALISFIRQGVLDHLFWPT